FSSELLGFGLDRSCAPPFAPFEMLDSTVYLSWYLRTLSVRAVSTRGQECQDHSNFWEDSSLAFASSEVRPSKTTSSEWHLGQRTTTSSSSGFSFGAGSSAGS